MGGLPAGSPLSTFLADCVLQEIDEKVNAKFKSILKWYRFLDDTFAALSDAREVDVILKFLNEFDPSLKFTKEMETEKGEGHSLTFLDVEITRLNNHCISRHYIKTTQSDRTVGFNSAHPRSVLKGIVKGEVKRSFENCTLNQHRITEANRIREKYLKNGYPLSLITKALNEWKPNKISLRKRDPPRIWAPIPYIKGLYEVVASMFRKFNVGVYSSTGCTIQSAASNGWKSKAPLKNEAGVVYGVTCKNCHKIYIGQTGRKLTERINEHKRAVLNKNNSNAVARHVMETKHEADFDNIKIIKREKKAGMRTLLESYTIAANATRKLNISPADNGMTQWIDVFRETFPDVI